LPREANQRVVRRLVEQAVSRRNLAALDEPAAGATAPTAARSPSF